MRREHDASPSDELVRALTLVFGILDRETCCRFRAVNEQRVAARLMEVFETIGEEARNEAASRYNVYPLRGAKPAGVIDADRLALYQAGEAIAEAAHRIREKSWRKGIAS